MVNHANGRLDQTIDMKHELVRLAQAIDCPVLEARFGTVYSDGAGMPPLPTRLMAGLAVAVKTRAMKPQDTRQVIVETTVQPNNVMFARPSLFTGGANGWCGWRRKRGSIPAKPIFGSVNSP